MAQANVVNATIRAVKSAKKFIPRRAAINLVSIEKCGNTVSTCMRCS